MGKNKWSPVPSSPSIWGYYWLKRSGGPPELVKLVPTKYFLESGAIEVWQCPGIGRYRLIIDRLPCDWQWKQIKTPR